jgi:AcrR family transcriptional regulator
MSRSLSAQAHQEVLKAAQELFAKDGIDASSMDAIAQRSGVSKATIYKHWPDKNALCLEVLARIFIDEPLPESSDVRADIVAALSRQPSRTLQRMRDRLMPHLQAYAARSPSFQIAFKKKAFEPSRQRLCKLLRRAVSEGKLRSDLDIQLGVALLLGPIIYRYAMRLLDLRLPPDMPERVVDAFWRAHATAVSPRDLQVTRRPRLAKIS